MERCPHCGVKIEAGGAKCGFCGAPLNVQNGAPPQFPPIPELYDRGYVLWDSLFLTPAFGSWCSWQNAKAMGNKETEMVALVSMPIFALLTIVSAVLVFVCVIPNIEPVSAKHVRALIVLINLIPWIFYYFIIHRPQVNFIKKYDIVCRKKSCFLPALTAFVLCSAVGAVFAAIMISANS